MKQTFQLLLLLAVLLWNQCECRSHGSELKTKSIQENEKELLEKVEALLEEKERRIDESKRENVETVVREALEEGLVKADRLREKQRKFKQEGFDGKRKRGRRNRLFKSSKESRDRQEDGFTLLSAKKALVKKTGKSLQELAGNEEYSEAWENILSQVTSHPAKRGKRATTDCSAVSDVNTYRTIDGTCNNLDNPELGSAGSEQPRLVTEVYADSVDSPRLSVIDDQDLPNPRTLSNNCFSIPDGQTEANLENFNTMMSMNWGQFCDHDIVLTPTFSGDDGASITCCGNDGVPVDRDECLGIALTPEADLNHITCMEFTRSSIAPDLSLEAGKQLTNEITSFIDASNVYGSSDTELAELRGTGGKMKTKTASGGELLPEDSSADAICTLDGADSDDYCQNAGDVRVNVQPGLGLLHLLFLKEHNRIVDELKGVNPSLSDDQLFNKARKIVGAMIQHITYNEYFFNVFDDQTIQDYGLGLLSEGYSTDYNSSCNPGITVGFATAAFRFGHSQIPHKLGYTAADFSDPTGNTDMQLTLKNPHMLINEAGSKILDLVRYMTSTQASKADGQFEDSIRNTLFNDNLDLTSLNIQRGRDHGLPSYTAWRDWCGLQNPTADDDWNGLVDIGNGKRELRNTYQSVFDIDLYVGGMLERRVATTNGDPNYLGATFSCILGKQFQNLKRCDRFWYERPAPEGFSPDQLQEIRKVSLSRVICDNAGDTTADLPETLPEIQRASLLNQANRQDCSNERRMPKMDFSKWASTKR